MILTILRARNGSRSSAGRVNRRRRPHSQALVESRQAGSEDLAQTTVWCTDDKGYHARDAVGYTEAALDGPLVWLKHESKGERQKRASGETS